MWVWKLFTTPLWGSKTTWLEPILFGSRLRRKVQRKLMIAFFVPLIATLGLMMFAESLEEPKFTADHALVVGIMFAVFFNVVYIFWGEDTSGSIRIRKRDIQRTRTYLRGEFTLYQVETWPFESISKCRIIHKSKTGYSFSLLMIETYSDTDRIGIPWYVDIKTVVDALLKAGVSVVFDGTVPLASLKSKTSTWLGVRLAVGGSFPATAVLVFGIAYLSQSNKAGKAHNTQQVAQSIEDQRLQEDLQNGGSDEKSPTADSKQESGDQADRLNSTPPIPFGPFSPFGAGPGHGPPSRMGPGRGPMSIAPPVGPPGSFGNSAPRTRQRSTPRRSTPTTPKVPTNDSEIVGGPEGMEFRSVRRADQPVIGIRYMFPPEESDRAFVFFEPLYSEPMTTGMLKAIVARKGYALGAMRVDTDDREVRAVRLAFMRIDGDHLDPKDVYTTEWIGTPTGKSQKTINGKGARVLGFFGRRKMHVTALGLAFEKQ